MDDFTLLMAVYANDDAAFFRAAYDSATRQQTRPPTFVVLVRDGPVGTDIADFLTEVESDPKVTVVRLEENRGLAAALNAGLERITTDIVARADADDICLPQRFAVQIPLVGAGLDIVGSAIEEFTDDPAVPGEVRHVRTTQNDIVRHARMQCPFHHPTVVFRKQAVLDAGGYPELPNMEDYLLWVRMIANGARVGNTDQVLVRYRVGAGAFARRGGRKLARSEAQLQKEFRAMGFTTRWQYVRNRLLRGFVYRHMPASWRQTGYHLWTRLRRPRQSTPRADREAHAGQ